MKLAVVFPGLGYHCDKPLLYYSIKTAERYGYEVIKVSYPDMNCVIKDEESLKRAVREGLRAAAEQLDREKLMAAEKLLFISKSIGTAIAAAYEKENLSMLHRNAERIRNLFFTPIGATFDYEPANGEAFYGTADWIPEGLIREGCDRFRLPLHLIKDGNHSLECGDTQADIIYLKCIMEHVERYIRDWEPCIKAVLFDLDGTLIDTEKLYRKYWPMACRDFDFELSDERALELRSLGRPYSPAKFKEWFGESFDYNLVRGRRKELVEEHIDKYGIDVKPGAKELLEYLRKKNIISAVCTATDPSRTKKYLKLVGLEGYFDKIISATMVECGKPSPAVYLYACRELGLDPKECVAVEDAPNGVVSAFEAGCRVIMVPDQTRPCADLNRKLWKCVDTLDEIAGYL